jgi:signal transduction histidine kinase
LGIEPELLSKITEPYFTTKDIGEGSGLGLSLVVGFVDQSGGSFRIFSTLGVGTTVELFLPRSSHALTGEKKPRQSRPRAVGATSTISAP